MNKYYLSLCRGLVNYYVLFEAPDEETVREHAVKYFGRIWCSIYTEDYFKQRISKYLPVVINPDKPIELQESDWE